MNVRVLTMPRLGETMEEGTIAAWLVGPGDAFKRGQPLVEVETDKTVVEYPALGDGVMEETLAAPGALVAVGAPIARVAAADWDDPAGAAPETTPETTPEATPAPQAARRTQDTPRPAAEPGPPRAPGAPLRATPVARRLARQAGVDLAALVGTGRRGRIEARDVTPGAEAAAASVLLVHGFAGDGTAWAALVAALSRGGRVVRAPDLPGHGADDDRPDGLEPLVAAVEADLAAAPGRVHVVGHSLGAYVSVMAALRLPHKVAGLTLIAPAGLGREIDGDFVRGMAGATTAGEVAHLLRRLGPKAAALSAPAIEDLAARLAQGRLSRVADALCGPQGQRIDLLGPLARLPREIPVRALIGVDDRIVPATQAFALPPRVATHFLPTGHMPQWDAPADVADLILEGLRNG